MTKVTDVGRLMRTIAHLSPGQLIHRVRLRGQRWLYWRRSAAALHASWTDGIPRTGGWPETFRPIDTAVRHPAPDGHQFDLIGERHDVAVGDWRPVDRSQLFRYHLHYMEWVWPLAADRDAEAFARLWSSWQLGTRIGRWDEWSPYVVALRSWTLCGVFDRLVTGSTIEPEVMAHQREALGFLERNLELDVGGNHLIKDLKAIIGLALFFDLPERAGRALARLVDEVDHQILADGGHFELSPSYHAQVMADLVDVVGLLSATEALPVPPAFTNAIARMGRWLAVMTYSDGSLPMLGDCTPPPEGLLGALRTQSQILVPGDVEHLESSGYVVIRPADELMVVIDVGRPCPAELPAHAQADWGTFEIWVGGRCPRRVVADPGVSTYIGARRRWERSTAAHNTVVVGDTDTTEVWGSFRAAELATPRAVAIDVVGDAIQVEAELVGRPDHTTYRREFTITAHHLSIVDQIDPIGHGTSNLTFADPADAWRATANSPFSSDATEIATSFGHLVPAVQLRQPLVAGAATWQLDLRDLVS